MGVPSKDGPPAFEFPRPFPILAPIACAAVVASGGAADTLMVVPLVTARAGTSRVTPPGNECVLEPMGAQVDGLSPSPPWPPCWLELPVQEFKTETSTSVITAAGRRCHALKAYPRERKCSRDPPTSSPIRTQESSRGVHLRLLAKTT